MIMAAIVFDGAKSFSQLDISATDRKMLDRQGAV